MNRLSVVLITLNEEKNIERCLESVSELADEIIIVDSGSTDKTLNIAKKYKTKIFNRAFDNYAAQKNFANSKATGDWIFSIDADEEVTAQLADEIRQKVNSNQFDGYLIPRRNILLRKEIKHTRWSPDKHIWLWRKDKGKWIGDIHEEVVINGPVGELKNAKIHHSYATVSEFLKMVNSYTTREAEYKVKNGIKFSWFRIFWDPILSFLRRYIYKQGYLDGKEGFILSCLMVFYRFTTWVKVWEIEQST